MKPKLFGLIHDILVLYAQRLRDEYPESHDPE